MKRLVIILCIISLCGFGFAEGFNISKPDAVGGNLVGMTQDQATYASGTPVEEGLSIGPGIEFFLKYDVSPKVFFTVGTGLNTINHNFTGVDVARTTFLPTFDLKVAFKPLTGSQFSPFIMAGLNAFGSTSTVKVNNNTFTSDRYYDAAVFVGAGAEVAVNDKISVQASGDLRFVVSSDADPQPQFWVAKAGIAYQLQGRQERPLQDEIEYPLGDDELASLDDLFQDSGSSDGFDDLDLLFAPEEEASGSMTESYSDEYDGLFDDDLSSSDVAYSGNAQTLQNRIEELRQKMDSGFQQLQQLENKVQENEQVIAGLSGDVAYAGISSGELNSQQFKQQYEQVLQKVNAKKYKDAIAGFRALMNGNPNHKLASNCQYWIGECYNALGDYSKAIQAFNSVMDYRSSYKFDDALIMTGLCSMKIGDNDNARQKFQELVNRYPDSEYAPKAMRYLGRL
ncbi:tol-pal system protein YbgF [bacterium]